MICDVYRETSSSWTMRCRQRTPSRWYIGESWLFSMKRSSTGRTTFRWLSSEGTMHRRQWMISVVLDFLSGGSAATSDSMRGSTYTRYSLNAL